MNQKLIEAFETTGGVFNIPPALFLERLKNIRAFVFDWDGVFNDGSKGEGQSSTYSEPDSVGTNLLRFSYWLKNEYLPICTIITGATNATAISFAKREHFNAVYSKAIHKQDALDHLCKTNDIEMNQVCWFYDDVLDLSIAQQAGLRICLPRKTGHAYNAYILENNLADYTCATDGGNYGVREACEMLMTLMGNFNEVVNKRVVFEGPYATYLEERNSNPPHFYIRENGRILVAEGKV